MHFLHLCMPLYHPDSTFATHPCMACQNWSWNVYRSYKIRLRVSWPALGDLLTSRPSCKDFTGCQSTKGLFLNCWLLHTSVYMVAHQITCTSGEEWQFGVPDNILSSKVKSAKHKNCGDRAFTVCSPFLWNRLPAQISATEDLSAFKSLMSTFYLT